MTVLQERLLEGRAVVLAGEPSERVAAALAAHGATIAPVAGDRASLHALVVDARGAFGDGGEDRLGTALEDAWRAIQRAASEALLPGASPGKIVLVAPVPDAGAYAGAARAALENLARTLSVEWARHGITAVAVAPGESTTDEQLAELVCFLVSEAGDYLSGCLLELGAVAC